MNQKPQMRSFDRRVLALGFLNTLAFAGIYWLATVTPSTPELVERFRAALWIVMGVFVALLAAQVILRRRDGTG